MCASACQLSRLVGVWLASSFAMLSGLMYAASCATSVGGAPDDSAAALPEAAVSGVHEAVALGAAGSAEPAHTEFPAT